METKQDLLKRLWDFNNEIMKGAAGLRPYNAKEFKKMAEQYRMTEIKEIRVLINKMTDQNFTKTSVAVLEEIGRVMNRKR